MNDTLQLLDNDNVQPIDLFNEINLVCPRQLEGLLISTPLKDRIDYFEVSFTYLLELFCNHCNSYFPNSQLLGPLPKNLTQLSNSTPLAQIMQHCFPLLYGLTSQKHNPYQKAILTLLSNKTPDSHEKSMVYQILVIFYHFAETKQIPPRLHEYLQQETYSPTQVRDRQQVVYNHMAHCCDKITSSLKGYIALGHLHNTDIDSVNDIICRIQCYLSYIRKKHRI